MKLNRASAMPLLACGFAAAASQGIAAPAARGTSPAPPAMLPARLLDCSLGRVINFDPKRDQPMSEFRYDGFHPVRLFLPAIAARTTPPPDPTMPGEPVDPATRIIADPDGIAGGAAQRRFDRVVDLWPTRVELTTPAGRIAWNVIVVAQVDLARSTATMFMSRANDAFTYDLKHMYFGHCRIGRPNRDRE